LARSYLLVKQDVTGNLPIVGSGPLAAGSAFVVVNGLLLNKSQTASAQMLETVQLR